MSKFPVLNVLYPYYIGKRAIFNTSNPLPVLDKFSLKTLAHVSTASKTEIVDAITTVKQSRNLLKKFPRYERKNVLLKIAEKIKERNEEIATKLVLEIGKSINDARGEVTRAVETFTIAAEESVRQGGEFKHSDISLRNQGIQTITSRFPIGLVSMIIPFNFPINLAAHKIGPAIAVGCPFILKPSERTPLSAVILGEILAETQLPENSYAILPSDVKDAPIFSQDDRIDFVSFTGSAKVGWDIKKNSGKKKVALELGGNASVIVDYETNIDYAVNRTFWGAFNSNGQSCISVQRVWLHEKIYDEFSMKLLAKVRDIKMGDPYEESTFLGPLIHEDEAKRIERWIKEAENQGGKILSGGKRSGSFLEPTIMENVPKNQSLSCQEAFGPICVLEKFSDIPSVINIINDSQYGLQAGIFTQNINKAFYAYNNLDVGGVVINDVPTLRVDSMPYGGLKDSGLGREGITYAMEDMTELKVMLLKDIGNL